MSGVSDLCVEGLYEAPLLTQVDAVKADEPVRRWHNLGHHRYLGRSPSMSPILSWTNPAMVAVDEDIGGGVADALDNWHWY